MLFCNSLADQINISAIEMGAQTAKFADVRSEVKQLLSKNHPLEVVQTFNQISL